MTHTFKRCGHPISEENARLRKDGSSYCRICRNAKRRADYQADLIASRRNVRIKMLPKKLAIARARVAKLEAEMIALGLTS